jgi:V8-like Glu-specific endopeptidase
MSGGTSGLKTGLTIQTDPNSPYCTYIAEGPNGALHYTCGIVKYVQPIVGGYGKFSVGGDSGAPVVSLSSIRTIAVYFLRGVHIAGGQTATDYYGLYMDFSAALAPHGNNFYPLAVAVP